MISSKTTLTLVLTHLECIMKGIQRLLTLMLQLAPAASVVVQVVDAILKLPTAKGAAKLVADPLVLVSVAVRVELAPMLTLPKFKLLGSRVTPAGAVNLATWTE